MTQQREISKSKNFIIDLDETNSPAPELNQNLGTSINLTIIPETFL